MYQVAREAFRTLAGTPKRGISKQKSIRRSRLYTRVRDDGAGIEPELLTGGRRSGHFGLQGMRERSERAGGTLNVWSERNVGTEVEHNTSRVAYARI